VLADRSSASLDLRVSLARSDRLVEGADGDDRVGEQRL